MKNLIRRFVREEEGQDLIEYSFLVVFIALVVMVILGTVGTSINDIFVRIDNAITGAS
jgi:pilus assembly protein Flp/PilA